MLLNHNFCAMVACHFTFQFQVLTLLKGTKSWCGSFYYGLTHIDLYRQWVHFRTKRKFEMNCARIEAHWNDSTATIPTCVLKLQQWICWWVKNSTHLAY
jgi:hypothetical protein